MSKKSKPPPPDEPQDAPLTDKQLQVEITSRLQLMWLQRMEKLMVDETISSTDMNTLARVLMANGWNIDPSRLPKNLRDKLTDRITPADLDRDEEDFIAGRIPRQA